MIPRVSRWESRQRGTPPGATVTAGAWKAAAGGIRIVPSDPAAVPAEAYTVAGPSVARLPVPRLPVTSRVTSAPIRARVVVASRRSIAVEVGQVDIRKQLDHGQRVPRRVEPKGAQVRRNGMRFLRHSDLASSGEPGPKSRLAPRGS